MSAPTAENLVRTTLRVNNTTHELSHDPRLTEQITVDSFVELVRHGAAADDGTLLGGASVPTVSLLVAQRDLASGSGIASLEGQSVPVSLQTAERYLCNSDIIPMLFAERVA